MIFSGTAATYGRGHAVVVATGMQTEMGRIAGMLKAAPAETTPLQKELDRVGKLLGGVVVAIAVVMIVTIILVEDVHGVAALFDVLILGVALAVAAVPEGLARRGDRRPVDRRAAHGAAQRDRAPSQRRSKRSARRTSSPPTRPAR